MIWLFYALFSRFIWAVCNAVEQLVTRAHKTNSITSAFLLVISLQLPLGIILLSINGTHGLTPSLLALLTFSGLCSMGGVLPFYMALERDDAHSVVPLFEFTPVILMIMAAIFLGEHMTHQQLAGAALVIACGFLFTWDFKSGHIRKRTLLLMLLSSFMFATYMLSLRFASNDASAWVISGTILCINGTIASTVLAFRPNIRHSIITTAKSTRGAAIILSIAVNVTSILGTWSLLRAFQLAPTTGQVAALSGAQPFFAFFIAVILGILLKKHYARVVFDREATLKLGLILGIMMGVYLLATGG